MQLINIKNLNLEKDGLSILENISFDVDLNAYIGIIGPNGAGKSSLIKCIAGIENDFTGEIVKSDHLKIGYVPQNYQLPQHIKISVLDVLEMGHEFKEPIVYLKMVGLNAEILKENFSGLSGGQKQRIIIARALMNDPNLLLFDEPFSGVDHKTKISLYELLNDLHLKNKIAIIFVSHEISQVVSNCKKIICLDKSIHEGCHPVNFSSGDKSNCKNEQTSNFCNIHHHHKS